jgi:hypothetical protein
MMREALATLVRSLPRAWSVWLVAALFFTATDLIDIVYGSGSDAAGATAFQLTPLTAASLALRVFFAIFIPAAALRAMLPSRRSSWALDRGFWLFAGVFILLTIVSFGGAALATRLSQPLLHLAIADEHAYRVASLVLLFVYLLAGIVLTARLALWPVSALLGDAGASVAASWRRMRGAVLPFLVASAILVLPFLIAHFALTGWLENAAMRGSARLAWTIADGFVSVFQVMLAMAVTAAAYRLTEVEAA